MARRPLAHKKPRGRDPWAWNAKRSSPLPALAVDLRGDRQLGPIEKADQVLGVRRLLQLADGLGLDLANPLAGDREDLPDLFQRVGISVDQPIAKSQNLPLAMIESVQHVGQPGLEQLLVD